MDQFVLLTKQTLLSTDENDNTRPIIKPYRAKASPKTKIRSITTKSFWFLALALAPALPAIPIAIPAAREDTPVQMPAARCEKATYNGTSVFYYVLVKDVLITIAMISPYIPNTPAMITGSVFFIACAGFITPEATTPFPDLAVP